jgi:hypothetical protein
MNAGSWFDVSLCRPLADAATASALAALLPIVIAVTPGSTCDPGLEEVGGSALAKVAASDAHNTDASTIHRYRCFASMIALQQVLLEPRDVPFISLDDFH